MVRHDTQKKKEDLENIKKVIVKFKGRINTEVRRQEKLDIVEEQYLEEKSYQESIW